jgi:hypothetical protein
VVFRAAFMELAANVERLESQHLVHRRLSAVVEGTSQGLPGSARDVEERFVGRARELVPARSRGNGRRVIYDFTRPIRLPCGSVNMAYVTILGIVVGGTTVLPPSSPTLRSAASRLGTAT